jgi:hypothetical protein
MSDTSDLTRSIVTHHETRFSREDLRVLTCNFARHGFIKVRDVVPDSIRASVRQEVFRLLDASAERRDLLLATTDYSPRHMSVVKSEIIAEHSTLIPRLAKDEALLGFLETIAKDKLHPATLKDEEFLITRQEKKGDTHGWHWGDYSFALIWLIEVPPLDCGGMLQCVPHTSWNKANPRIHEHLCENPIQTYGFVSGDIYFLRTDTTLHRTVPLNRDATRIILNMTWASPSDLARSIAGNDRWWENKGAQAAVSTATV